MRRGRWVWGVVCAGCLGYSAALGAHAPSGAIFTTLADGSEVNVNQYASKEEVYLDGGPGIGAPPTAAALDNGTYYFQVTDPSGKTLLSTDSIECRRFRVTDGLITYEPEPTCTSPHVPGVDADHGGQTIQLMPYDDTPNPGGVYKVWATFTEDYGCAPTDGGCKHGFLPRHSKTDNFKVKQVPIREIDVVFLDAAWQPMAGFKATWKDPLGGSNDKWSYFLPQWGIIEAHVEAIEEGDHTIIVEDQPELLNPDGSVLRPACLVGEVWLGYYGHTYVGWGGSPPGRSVEISVQGQRREFTEFVSVYCQ